MSIRKVVAGLLITAGIAIMAVPFFWRTTGEKQTEQLIREFEQTLEDDYDEETDVEENGSRYGTFFTPLSQISIGDEVMITDKNGLRHIYEVTETEVVNPYDNSIKTQGDEKELTLFTCSRKGTMRFVVRCIYKEAVLDE